MLVARILASGPATLVAAAEYTITDLAFVDADPLNWYVTKPWISVNNNGQVAISGQGAYGPWHGAYYSAAGTTSLPFTFQGFAVDSGGSVLGGDDYWGIGLSVSKAAIWHPDGTLTTLGLHESASSLGDANSSAYSVNSNGKIVGGSDPFGYEVSSMIGGVAPRAFARPSHAFLYEQGAFHDLGTLGGSYSLAYDINNSGRIVGMSTIYEPTFDNTPEFHAAYSDGGTFQDLNSLVGSSDWTLESATDINDAGQITGWGTLDGQRRAYLFDAGIVHELDVLPGYDFSIGRGINAAGDVVGYSATGQISDPQFIFDEKFYYFLASNGQDRAFLYRNGTMHDLNSLVDPASGWTILGATDINDGGQIVGWGTLAGEPDYVIHALLLTPVPEPSGLMLGVLAVASMLSIAALRMRRCG